MKRKYKREMQKDRMAIALTLSKKGKDDRFFILKVMATHNEDSKCNDSTLFEQFCVKSIP
jgi:hypothetical protein